MDQLLLDFRDFNVNKFYVRELVKEGNMIIIQNMHRLPYKKYFFDLPVAIDQQSFEKFPVFIEEYLRYKRIQAAHEHLNMYLFCELDIEFCYV